METTCRTIFEGIVVGRFLILLKGLLVGFSQGLVGLFVVLQNFIGVVHVIPMYLL